MNRKMQTIIEVARALPGALDMLDQNARKAMSLADDFKSKHWESTEGMRVTQRVNLPNVESGIVAMGPLLSVVYLATKGGRTFEWEHEFDEDHPILSYAHDGSGLVIVRGRSKYTVTKRGIEG